MKLSSDISEAILDPIINDALTRAKRAAGNHYPEGDERDTFQFNLNGDTYYLTANNYLLVDENAILKYPNKMVPGYCVFYLYDQSQTFVSSFAAKLGDGRTTTCIDIFGVSGVAFRGKPAILAVLQYYYTNGPIGHSISEIGNNWILTTILMPLVQQADGKWTFTQDTSCFSPTNRIKTLRQAERYLAANCK